MIAKYFLAVIGASYIGLAAWCAYDPRGTGRAIGLDTINNGGRSEYFTIYGGLQTGLGLLFLWPLIRDQPVGPFLLACLLVHGGIVIFRSLSFALYDGIPGMTQGFAVGEWVIFLATAYLYWKGE